MTRNQTPTELNVFPYFSSLHQLAADRRLFADPTKHPERRTLHENERLGVTQITLRSFDENNN
jgi:hypothetical protein